MSFVVFIAGLLLSCFAGWRMANGIHPPQTNLTLGVVAFTGYAVMLVAFIFVRN
ncbi:MULTISPECIES: hypothetical protein [unclassified Mesorhizobium]|uniref:hypothetical protein n=1 Tax=unclassified Mesorhizobium TaxID=325217 RepID=UPI0013DF119C|nr:MULTISPECIES: hypothetical protein [unclassified Mesorhizobium]